ncbi:hypothetical protein OEZ86_002014 [Tetradesmus obliquus]|nr:hypothetical protein OEZ86_002014 [Tetradesmus obliquus]
MRVIGFYSGPGQVQFDSVNGSGDAENPLNSYDPWEDARPRVPAGGVPAYEQTDWGWDAAAEQDWDPAAGLGPEQLADLERDYQEQMDRRRGSSEPPRDKWITPLLDWQSISGAFDPDQSRTEESMADEALTNKEESREALAFAGRLVAIPLITGALISRAITEPVLSFSLQNNPNAFAMTGRQKIEGASAVHLEETRVKMMMAIGQAPPLDDESMLRHLHEYALEVQEEERQHNEANLMTAVSDSISAMVFFLLFVRDTQGRAAIFNTLGRLFEGLSDIAKAVMIILIADTLLGYHSEEGWTGFLDLFLGHYGIEVEEENILLFVGIVPIAIDVWFKYWIFIGLNKISPGAVVTIKQLDRH